MRPNKNSPEDIILELLVGVLGQLIVETIKAFAHWLGYH